MDNKLFKQSIFFITGMIVTFGLSLSLQSLLAAWTAPTQTPPNANVYPPIYNANPSISPPIVGSALAISGYLDVTSTSYDPVLSVTSDGGVGAGFSQPLIRLRPDDLAAAGTYWDIYGSDGSGTPAPRFGISLTTGGSTENFRLVIDQAGNVGIGANSPGALLHIGTSAAGNRKLLQIAEPGYVGTYGLVLRGDSADGIFKWFGLNNSVETASPILTMNRFNGNVGIGTPNPGYKLDVAGQINAAGTIFSNGNAVCQQNGTNCPSLGATLRQNNCVATAMSYNGTGWKTCPAGYYAAGINCDAAAPGGFDWDQCQLYCCAP